MSKHGAYYWGKIFLNPKRIVWTGPLTRTEMRDKCDIFRHNIARSKPDNLITVDEAERLTEKYYEY